MNVLPALAFAVCLAIGQVRPSDDDLLGQNGKDGETVDPETWQEREARIYIRKIFERYGQDGLLSFEGFEHLMEGLGLGNIVISDHGVAAHKITDKFRSLHPDHNHGITAADGSSASEDSRSDEDSSSADEDGSLKGVVYHHVDKHHHHNHRDEVRNVSRPIDESSEDDGVVKRSLPQHPEHDHDSMDSKVGVNTSTRKTPPTHGSLDLCLSPQEILQMYKIQTNSTISVFSFINLCPAILYQIEHEACHMIQHNDHGSHASDDDHLRLFHSGQDHEHVSEHDYEYDPEHDPEHDHVHYYHHHHHYYHPTFVGNDTVAVFMKRSFLEIPGKVWGYAILSVTAISLVGLVCVAVVPVMNRMMYDYLVNFLVALAVGTLTGDSLLHLIPHSLVTHSHEEDEEANRRKNEAIYKGCVVLGGIYLFFITERMMTIVTDLRKKRQNEKERDKSSNTWTEMSDYEGGDSNIGERLSRHGERINSCQNFTRDYSTQISGQVIAEENIDELKKLQECDDHHHCNQDPDDVTIMMSKNDNSHKGHGHGDEAPKTISSIAWMVIMGDGLHNFTDGLAIGAAFGASLTVGLSTSIAVFCHELPHELGDFAVLLKAGMSVKLALFYNIVSSILCFIGLVIGVAIGNISSAGSWIFALTAGIFLYISLVDMLPEIAIAESIKSQRKCCHLLLQILGISTGVAIMLVIALFESDIKIG